MMLGQWVEQAKMGDACIVDTPSGDKIAIIALGNEYLCINQTSLSRYTLLDTELFLPQWFSRDDVTVPAEIVVGEQARHES